jgi:glutathione S-transferase
MTELVIYGIPQSTYVRTARMACIEKGVPHTLEPLAPRSEALLKLHPFGRVPVLRHGDFMLYETSAIMRYVDEAFDGPALSPKEPRQRARMEQWISTINSYFYDAMIRRLVLAYYFPQTPDGKPDRAVIDGVAGEVRRQLQLLDDALGEGPFLFGATPSLADLLLAPILTYVYQTPEGGAMMKELRNVPRAGGAMQGRKSFQETAPPAPKHD